MTTLPYLMTCSQNTDTYASHNLALTDAAGRLFYKLDDTWVVAHDQYLKKYNSNINVEMFNSVLSVKYL